MKKIVLLIYFISISSFAQLYVSPSSFVYAKNAFIFVQQDVNLDTNSNLYLRNESQLLQGSTATSANVGAGKLSIFQEGTCNNFAYNYWCSPVGNASATVGNEPFGITMLGQPTSTTATTTAIDLPVSNRNGIANPLSIASRWIYKFLSSTNYSQWIPVFNASTINSGQGFSMKGTSGTDATNVGETAVNNPGNAQRYDFRGKPNDGNINILLGASPNNTLTGNPYPSAIDLKKFLSTAPGIAASTGIAYFWEHDKANAVNHLLVNYRGGYGAYSTAGANGTYVPATYYAYDDTGAQTITTGAGMAFQRRFSPVGQGFMMQGNGAGGTVTMTNDMRVFVKEGAANFSQFERNTGLSNASNSGYLPVIQSVSGYDYTQVKAEDTPQIRFRTLLNNTAVRITSLAFDPEATDAVDFSKDAPTPGAGALDSYFVLITKPFVISAINFDENKRIAVGFKADSDAIMKFRVNEMINFSGVSAVYLFDKVTNIYHDVTYNDYEFSIPAGLTDNRYEITFKKEANAIVANTSDFVISQNNTKQILVVSNPNAFDINSVSLFDISGKLLLDKTNLGTSNSFEFSTINFSDGIYIVKVNSVEKENFGQKIIIKK